MPYQLDEAAWPFVTVRWSGAAQPGEMQGFLVDMDRLLAKDTRFGLLIDSRGAADLPGGDRRMLLAHMRNNRERTAKLLAQAVVYDNAIHRTLYSMISWIFPPPYPSKTFSSMDDATAWLKAELASPR